MVVQSPFEFLEIPDRGVRTFHVRSWEEGTTTISTVRQPDGKEIRVLRIFVAPDEQPIGLDYWDITSITLIAQLRPILQRADLHDLSLTIMAFGERPMKRFTVQAAPA